MSTRRVQKTKLLSSSPSSYVSAIHYPHVHGMSTPILIGVVVDFNSAMC